MANHVEPVLFVSQGRKNEVQGRIKESRISSVAATTTTSAQKPSRKFKQVLFFGRLEADEN